MSSFNTVTKIKYTDNSGDPVTLDEYIVFQDDKANRKYIVFRFINNVTQQLLGMQFEVCQYDADGDMIEKSVVAYNKFLAGAEQEFTPKAKLRVSYNCASLSVRLIQAAFDRFVWEGGEFKDTTYKFDMFYHDEVKEREEEDEEEGKKGKKAKHKAVKEPKVKKTKVKKNKRPFVMKDATAGNISVFPRVFNVILMIAVLAFVVVSLFFFKKTAKRFTSGDYLVRVINAEEAAVYGYTGGRDAVIPEKIDGYKIIKIDGGAFKNSDIATLTLKGEVTIHAGAFVNCTNLSAILAEKPVIVLEDAFSGCTSMSMDYFYYPESGSDILDRDFIN